MYLYMYELHAKRSFLCNIPYGIKYGARKYFFLSIYPGSISKEIASRWMKIVSRPKNLSFDTITCP